MAREWVFSFVTAYAYWSDITFPVQDNKSEHSNSPAREPDQYFELSDSSPVRKREKPNLSQAEARL